MPSVPHLDVESSLWDEGVQLVCGMDEVGRGAWAGPVVIGAAVLSRRAVPSDGPIALVRDSKLLSAKRRTELLPHVVEWVTASAVGAATPEEIDSLGMTASLRLAATRALDVLATSGIVPGRVLLDGPHDYLDRPDLVTPIVKGDMSSLSIASASIVAKVHRDRVMEELSTTLPGYGFERHAGYGSKLHQDALRLLGASSAHRVSWSFMRNLTSDQMSIEDLS